MLAYDTAIQVARKRGRLPAESIALYEEIVKKLQSTIRETKLQHQERVEKEMDALYMNKLSHSTFRVLWEHLLEELEDAGVDMPTSNMLFRRYLGKITQEFRSIVLGRLWLLDGEKLPPRKPVT